MDKQRAMGVAHLAGTDRMVVRIGRMVVRSDKAEPTGEQIALWRMARGDGLRATGCCHVPLMIDRMPPGGDTCKNTKCVFLLMGAK